MTIKTHPWSSCLIQLKINTQAVKPKESFIANEYIKSFSQIDYGCATLKKKTQFLHKDKMENKKVHCDHNLSRVRWQLSIKEMSSLCEMSEAMMK